MTIRGEISQVRLQYNDVITFNNESLTLFSPVQKRETSQKKRIAYDGQLFAFATTSMFPVNT